MEVQDYDRVRPFPGPQLPGQQVDIQEGPALVGISNHGSPFLCSASGVDDG